MVPFTVTRCQWDFRAYAFMIISIFYGLTYGFLRDLLSKLLKNRTYTGPGPVSGPGPARSGPGPQDFSPVRYPWDSRVGDRRRQA